MGEAIRRPENRPNKAEQTMTDPDAPDHADAQICALPPEADRAAYVRALIASRCPELSDSDLTLLHAPPDPDTLPGSIGEAILEVCERMADRLDALESAAR